MPKITIRPVTGTYVVRAGGAVLGETKNALELTEIGHAPVIYFPRSDIAMAFFDTNDHTTHCPHKGDANHFNVITKSRTIENAAWSYENPLPDVAQIGTYLAFYTSDLLAVERI